MNRNNHYLKSDRLKQIADYVEKGVTFADVGTDHGYLPLHLVENNCVDCAILLDLNIGPLKIAWKNVMQTLGEELPFVPNTKVGGYEFRLGNGLAPLQNAEVDVIAIAGMGGELIVEILSEDKSKSESFVKYIFQPRTNSAILRQWLYENDWSIVDESLAEENGKLCELIVASPTTNGSKYSPGSNPIIEFELPTLLIKAKPHLLKKFVEYKIAVEEKIFEGLKKSNNANAREKLIETEQRISVLKEIYKGVKEND